MINTTRMTREFDETVQSMSSLLVFRMAEQAFALNIETVDQIIPMLRLTPVPQIDHTIEGIANIHGALVPVISVRRHLGLPELRPGLYTPIILTRVGTRQVGWIVDEVMDVINVPSDSIIVPATILPEGMENSPVMSGLVYNQDRSILVLDPRYILRPSQFRKLNRAFPSGNDGGAQPGPAFPVPDCDEGYELTQGPSPDRAALETVRAALARKQSELQAEAPKVLPRPAPVERTPVIRSERAAPETAAAPKNGKSQAAAEDAAPDAVEAQPAPEATSPAAAPSAQSEPPAPSAEAPAPPQNGNGKKPRKRGGKKTDIIPNTAISAQPQPAAQPAAHAVAQKGRSIRAALAEQFAALADAVRETEQTPGIPG